MRVCIQSTFVIVIALLASSPALAQEASKSAPASEQQQNSKCCAQQQGGQKKAGQGKCGGDCQGKEGCGKEGCCKGGKGGHGQEGVSQQGRGRGGHGKGGHGKGRQGGHGKGGHGAGHGHDARHSQDRELFHLLLANHEKISRTVTQRPDGVETLTESDDPTIAAKIKEHVQWMQHRVENGNPIRQRDPLFQEIFRHTKKITMKREETTKGVRVIETSADPYVAKLIKAHAKVVSGFVERGFAEARPNHPVPAREQPPAEKQ